MSQTAPQLLAALMDTVPDRIFFKDREGRFLSVNRALLAAHDLPDLEAIKGRTDFDFFAAEHARNAYRDEQLIISTGEPMVAKLERETLSNGSVTWVSTTKVPVRDADGTIIGLCGISRNITEAYQQEELLKISSEALAEKREQLEVELALAREVQLALLPQSFPTFPPEAVMAESAIRFAHRYIPEGRIGGDFFTVNRVSETKAAVLICDVMGQGVPAALVTAVMRVLEEEIKFAADDPGAFLGEFNTRLHHFLESLATPMLVTALYMVMDSTTGEVRFANAGHPRPLHIGKAAVRAMGERRPQSTPALGVATDSIYPTEQAVIGAGDSILFYTDGLRDLGEGRILPEDSPTFLQLVEKCVRDDQNHFLDAMLTSMRELAGRNRFLDDVCLISAQFVGAKAEASA